MYLTPSTSAINWIRCGEILNSLRALRQEAGGTPKLRASAVAAAMLLRRCGVKTPKFSRSSKLAISSALSARSSRKARSTSKSSTKPTLLRAGVPKPNPIARAPSLTSAASTSDSVAASSRL